MSRKLSESGIVRAVAEEVCERLTRKVIADLQGMKGASLSGDDSGLKSTWEEICVQVQQEHSFHWDAYDDTVRKFVAKYVAELALHEREAVWLQTSEGEEWDCEEEDDRERYPVADDHIIAYVAEEHIYAEAGSWSNERIRAYIDRPA